ncbi:MAG TPA: hypothetical protein VF540_00400 [Segetibacter sp.]
MRSLLSELMHLTAVLGGKVVSVTTDGFITNIPDLENKLLEFIREKGNSNSLLLVYRDWRKYLSNDPTALEVKREGKEMIS